MQKTWPKKIARLMNGDALAVMNWNFLFSSQVAIKIISKKNAPPEYLQKFMPREIDALNATCRHRNVVSAFSLPFIVHLAI